MGVSSELEQLGFEDPESSDQEELSPEQNRKRQLLRAWLTSIGLSLVALIVAAAVLVLIGLGVAPDKTKEVIGSASTQVKHQVQQVAGHTPRVVLGGDGGQELVDQCPGSWVHMVAYAEDGMESPVYSAHNGCWGEDGRGDIILPLGIGDRIDVVTHDGQKSFKVVQMQDVPQFTTTVDDIRHLNGTLILQTCYWDGKTMKFVVLEPVM